MIFLFSLAIDFNFKKNIYDYGIVSLENISSGESWLVRGHEQGNGYGSPYEFSFVIKLSNSTAYAIGLCGKSPNREQRQAVGEFLENVIGIPKRVYFQRMRKNKITNNNMGFR